MKPNQRQRNSFFNPLLTIIVIATFLPALVSPGPVLAAASPAGSPYIIVFKDVVEPTAAAQGVANAYGLQPGFVYQHALKGMSALVPDGRLIALQHDPRVAYVVEDMERSIDVQSMPTGIHRIFADANPEISINGVDDYRVDVDVAVIDTGVDFQHPDLNVMGGVVPRSSFGQPAIPAVMTITSMERTLPAPSVRLIMESAWWVWHPVPASGLSRY